MGNRTKGIQADLSGYANAAQLRVRGAESLAAGLTAVGQGVGQGVARLRAAREKAAADREDARRFDATLNVRKDAVAAKGRASEQKAADALAKAKARQQLDDFSSQERLFASRLAAEMGEYDAMALEGIGRPETFGSPEWGGRIGAQEAKIKSTRQHLEGIRAQRAAFAQANPGLDDAPQIVVPTDSGFVDITSPEFRGMKGAERLAQIEDALQRGKMSNGQRIRLLAARGVAMREVTLAKEQAAHNQQSASDREKQGRMDEAARLLREQFQRSPSFKGLPGLDADDLAAQVAAGLPVRSAMIEARRRMPKHDPTPAERAEFQVETEEAVIQARQKRGLPPSAATPQTPADQVAREREVNDERIRQGIARTGAAAKAEHVGAAVRDGLAKRDHRGRAAPVAWDAHPPKDIAHAIAHGVLTAEQAKDAASRLTPAAREVALQEWFEEQARLRKVRDDDALADLLAEGQKLYGVGR